MQSSLLDQIQGHKAHVQLRKAVPNDASSPPLASPPLPPKKPLHPPAPVLSPTAVPSPTATNPWIAPESAGSAPQANPGKDAGSAHQVNPWGDGGSAHQPPPALSAMSVSTFDLNVLGEPPAALSATWSMVSGEGDSAKSRQSLGEIGSWPSRKSLTNKRPSLSSLRPSTGSMAPLNLLRPSEGKSVKQLIHAGLGGALLSAHAHEAPAPAYETPPQAAVTLGWSRHETDDGAGYLFNESTGESVWEEQGSDVQKEAAGDAVHLASQAEGDEEKGGSDFGDSESHTRLPLAGRSLGSVPPGVLLPIVGSFASYRSDDNEELSEVKAGPLAHEG